MRKSEFLDNKFMAVWWNIRKNWNSQVKKKQKLVEILRILQVFQFYFSIDLVRYWLERRPMRDSMPSSNRGELGARSVLPLRFFVFPLPVVAYFARVARLKVSNIHCSIVFVKISSTTSEASHSLCQVAIRELAKHMTCVRFCISWASQWIKLNEYQKDYLAF